MMTRRRSRRSVIRRGLPALALALLSVVAFSGCSAPDTRQPVDESTGAETAAEAPAVLIPAPDLSGIELRNQNDEAVSFVGLRGKPALMSFIYTRCPMPEMCPATMLRFQEVQNALSAQDRSRVRLITVTFDPAYDTPAVLGEYARLWDVDAGFWDLLTGAEEDIQRIASSYGLWYEQTEDGNFDHAMYSMFLLPDGSLHEILSGTAWDADQAAAKLVELAGAPTPAPH